jgi:Mn2+/Fe2+ NRAMP family transporter
MTNPKRAVDALGDFPVRPSIWVRLVTRPLSKIGPGLITGVADDDPSGIATYSQAGAQFGLNMLWTMPLAFPLMAVIQAMCAKLGRVTGQGLAANIKDSFSPTVLRMLVALLVLANTLNIAADIAAMGEVGELITHANRHFLTLVFALAMLALQIYVPYRHYVVFLKWLSLSLLAYVGVLFTINVPWHEVITRTIFPTFRFTAEAATVIVAVLGTTISPYLFFWQASEEVEDMLRKPNTKALRADACDAPAELRRIELDTWSGMFYSNITAYFIILVTGLTLHASGISSIDTAADAALALRPLAGNFAFALFGAGIIGVGLIGVPVLAGSAAYAVAETMGWRWSLEYKAPQARGFYATIGLCMIAALAIQSSPISPMKALFWSAVINGIVAVPLIVIILLLVSRRSVMGEYASGWFALTIGWLTAATMAVAAIRMLLPG